MPFRVSFALIVLLLAGGAARADEAPLSPARDAAELEQRLTAILKQHGVPGLGAVAFRGGETPWLAGLGLADRASGRAATPDTPFRIGSITKMFTALSVLTLVEQGKLDLQAPVRTLLPDLEFTNPWEASDPVRVVHLLEHTTGWDDVAFREFALSDPRPLPLAEALKLRPATRTSRWRPGTRYAYSNAGPPVAAAIVEKLSGRPFEAFLQETLLQPLGLSGAGLLLTPQVEPRLARLYAAEREAPLPYWHFAYRPAGALHATPREMGLFLRFLLGRGELEGKRLLSEASLRRMETPTSSWAAQGGLTTGCGLHNATTLDEHGFVWHGHRGVLEGGLAELLYLPEAAVGYFFATNGDDSDAFEKIGAELQAYLTRGLTPPPAPPAAPLPAGSEEFAGWYVPVNPKLAIADGLNRLVGVSHVSFAGGHMLIELPGLTVDTLSVGGRRFRTEKQGAAGGVLVETPEGRVLALGSGAVLRQVSPLVAWLSRGGLAAFLLAFLTVPLFALVWVPRWLRGRLRGAPALHLRVLPLLAVLSVVAGLALFTAVNAADTAARLGRPTPWSVGLWLSTWAFAAFSVAGLAAAVRARKAGGNRFAYAHSLAVSAVFSAATLYLAWWGLIGYRSWS